MNGVLDVGARGQRADHARALAAYRRDGFVNGGRVLSEDAVAAAIDDLERFAEAPLRGDTPAGSDLKVSELGHDFDTKHFRLENLWKLSASFNGIVHDQALLAIVSTLLKTRLVQLWSDTVQYKPAHSGGPVNWHQDAPYHRGIRPLNRTIAAWIALDDADEESGCMWMVPGSHKWGNREPHLRTFAHVKTLSEFAAIKPPEDVPADEWRGAIPCPVRRGEVHFHHPFMWHGSPMNRSSRARRGYSLFLLSDDVYARGNGYAGLPEGARLSDAADRFPILHRA